MRMWMCVVGLSRVGRMESRGRIRSDTSCVVEALMYNQLGGNRIERTVDSFEVTK